MFQSFYKAFLKKKKNINKKKKISLRPPMNVVV